MAAEKKTQTDFSKNVFRVIRSIPKGKVATRPSGFKDLWKKK